MGAAKTSTAQGGRPAGPGPAAASSGGTVPGSLLLSIAAAELHEVKGRQERLIDRGAFTITLVDKPPSPPRAPLPAARAPPAPPTQPAGKQSLYPDVYQAQPAGEGSRPSSRGSEGGSDDGGGASSSIVAALGGHAWELLPASQTLKAGEVTFVFSLPGQDAFYTVVLSSDTDAEALGMLEGILETVTLYRESQALLGDAEAAAGEAALAEHAYRSSLAQGVHRASKALATGLLASATYASDGITRSASFFRPAEPTATPTTISPFLKNRVKQTEGAARAAASVVNTAVSGLAWAGAKVAGGVLWLTGNNKPLKEGEESSTLREVGHAAVLGFTEVWDSMEEAGKLVLLSARDSTTDVVRQRYGADAAEVSHHSFNAAGHSAEAFLAARKLGVRTVAKAAAKKTAKGVIHKWAGVAPAAKPGSASAIAGSSRGGSRAGSAGNLAVPPPAKSAM